jgi:predicted transcriptional regulator
LLISLRFIPAQIILHVVVDLSSEDMTGKRSERIRRIEEAISRIREIIEELKKQDVSKRDVLLKQLEEAVGDLRIIIEDTKKRVSPEYELTVIRESLREVTNMFKTIGELVKDSIISYMDKQFNARKLGEDIASLYTSLKNAGLPDQMINDIVKEYTKKALSGLNIGELVEKLLSMLQGFILIPGARGGMRVVTEFKKKEEEKGEKEEKE